MIILDEDLTLPASNSTFIFDNIVSPVIVSPRGLNMFNPIVASHTPSKRIGVPPLKILNIKV